MTYLEKLLGKNERIEFTTRRHWTAFLGQAWLVIILFLLAIGASIAINVYSYKLTFGLQREQQILVREGIVVILLLYPIISILGRYFRWQAEQYVVTDLRVIHLRGVLAKNVIDSSLDKVNDVMLQQSFLGRIFGYADLEILTASETGINRFPHIAHPLEFKGAMLEAKQALERGVSHTTDQIPDLIAKLANLRNDGALSEEEFQVEKTRLLRGL